jgi:prepilin-type processing-associated H-X9-DG protein
MFSHRQLVRPARRAFTLVELLVMISIITIAMGLLFPAIQRVRETANRIRCSRNLGQLAVACQLFENQYHVLPSAGIFLGDLPTFESPGRPARPGRQRGGWGYQVLPYIEQESAWRGGGGSTIRACQENAVAAASRMQFCPTRSGVRVFPHPDLRTPAGMTDYAGANFDGTGALRYDHRGWPLAKIRRGLGTTLLLGEKRMNVANLKDPNLDDDQGFCAAWDHDTMRFTTQPPQPDCRAGFGEALFGSSHPGGVNMAFVDGSVRFVRYKVEPNVFRHLGDIRESMPPPGDY